MTLPEDIGLEKTPPGRIHRFYITCGRNPQINYSLFHRANSSPRKIVIVLNSTMRLLIVEDSESLRRPVSTAFRKSGYAVDSAGSGDEGLWLDVDEGLKVRTDPALFHLIASNLFSKQSTTKPPVSICS